MHAHAPDVAEPEDFFDAILRRKPGPHGFKPHPAGISSLLFAFANLIIHDLCKRALPLLSLSLPLPSKTSCVIQSHHHLSWPVWTNNQPDPDSPMDNKPNDEHTKKGEKEQKRTTDGPSEKRGRSNQWQNRTSSYLSLDPLYGVNQAEQDKVRDYSEHNLGKGLLFPDSFASSRLLLMPSASCALLVLFCRNRPSQSISLSL
jgi:hypothetical protein